MRRRGARWIAVGAAAGLLVAVAVFAQTGSATQPAPVGRAVPVTTVAVAYVIPGRARLVASTDLDVLRGTLAGTNVGTGCCFSGVNAPLRQLLLAFSPAVTACTHVTRIDARLTDDHDLQISASLRACHVGPGQGSLPQGEELLLAIPLSELPAGRLTVNVSTFGDERFGTPPTSAAVTVS